MAIVWTGIVQNNNQKKIQLSAQEHVRNQWDNLKPMNPHRAAHYGSYVFKPVSILNSVDEGVNSITGNVLKLEGHVQNEIVYSEASQSISISKFGKLKSSLVLQYVIPLFLIFLAYSSISSERETGRLKLLIFQGIPLSRLGSGLCLVTYKHFAKPCVRFSTDRDQDQTTLDKCWSKQNGAPLLEPNGDHRYLTTLTT